MGEISVKSKCFFFRFGELISSSNEKVSDEIEIITDGTLLFTVELVEPPSVCCKSKEFNIERK